MSNRRNQGKQRHARPRGATHRCVLARRELPLRRADLPHDNPLLREPLRIGHIKRRLLGHWGTTPGLNFIYVHLNRLIKENDLDAIYVCGPGHGGPGMVANTYLEGTYSEYYPDVTQDIDGMRKLFTQFSFPGGIPSHASPETPGSIHEGGELGYSLMHAYGAVFDNPDLVAQPASSATVKRKPRAGREWLSNNFLNPVNDGAVLPILHLNGYKIANPAVLARISNEQLTSLMAGYGHKPYFVEGSDPETMHRLMAATLDSALAEIRAIQRDAREHGFRTPAVADDRAAFAEGMDGPKFVEDCRRKTRSARTSDVGATRDKPRTPGRCSRNGCAAINRRGLFDESGKLIAELAALAPVGTAGWGPIPTPTAACCYAILNMRISATTRWPWIGPAPSKQKSDEGHGSTVERRDDTQRRGAQLRVMGPRRDRIESPQRAFEVTNALRKRDPASDDQLAPDGRVMEILVSTCVPGLLEGFS